MQYEVVAQILTCRNTPLKLRKVVSALDPDSVCRKVRQDLEEIILNAGDDTATYRIVSVAPIWGAGGGK